MTNPSQFSTDRTHPGRWTIAFSNPPINNLEPVSELAEAKPLTHIEAFELDHIPKHLLVLGAGCVGLELAQAFRRFGAEVTLIDRNGRLACHEDEDVSQGLEEMCRDEGIAVMTNAKISRVEGNSGQCRQTDEATPNARHQRCG